jgi:membrane-associated protease RseP (regulator of RpoE activity)
MITGLIILAAVGILAWGLYRALPLGKLGIVAWAQSSVLMVPWLLLFGLGDLGVPINLVEVLFSLVLSIGIYIGLGRWLRAIAAQLPPQPLPPKTLSTDTAQPPVEANGNSTVAPTLTPASPVSAPPMTLEPSMPDADQKAIQGIFGIDTFFVTETLPYQGGVICNGNLRGEPAFVHQRLSASLQERLPDQYRLFLIRNPQDKPVVVILPRRNDPKPATVGQKVLAAGLFMAAIATCLETSALLQNFSFFAVPSQVMRALPLAIGILSTQAAHELGHRLTANRYQVRLSLPFLIPTWQIGTFGAITRFESLLPNRKALFDIALAGPGAGGLVSLLILLMGLVLSDVSSPIKVATSFFQSSVLVGTLARVVLGDLLKEPVISIHPLVAIGWLGLVVTALNLMPAGQLDGGRMVQAIYGRKVASRSTVMTLIILGVASLTSALPLYWALVILFLQRNLDQPALEEVTELDDTRAGLGLLALFLMAATLIPLAPGLAGRLGIGG